LATFSTCQSALFKDVLGHVFPSTWQIRNLSIQIRLVANMIHHAFRPSIIAQNDCAATIHPSNLVIDHSLRPTVMTS
jgi:hypothetical protein